MVNEQAEEFQIRLSRGGTAVVEGFYGGEGTYGDDTLTYGSEAGEPALLGVSYVISPVPTARPNDAGWHFTTGDTARPFLAQIVEYNNAAVKLSLSSVIQAYLILTEYPDAFADAINRRALLLELPDEYTLRYDWKPGDLAVAARYHVAVLLEFESGRRMTLEANDQAQMTVAEAV